jgi:predicted deacylase
MNRMKPSILTLIILLTLGGCQQNGRPTSTAVPPGATPAALIAPATRQPRTVADQPTAPSAAPAASPSAAPGLIFIPPLATRTPYPEPTPDPLATIIGRSAEGRAIIARRMGAGDRALMLVGGIHGGWEANTVTLINELISHFDSNPADILPGLSLILIPAANPDGVLRGRDIGSRFNANGVDLNRNWGCGWSADAVWRSQPVSAGEAPFSEPETQALADYIRRTQPATVLFYHSAAAGVYAGTCGGDQGSLLMSQIYGQATGYSYGQGFTAYRVTGTAAAWVNSIGIPSADVELQTQTHSEFARNLAGVLAVQRWLAAGPTGE